ncbi:MAG: hypothetical protein HWN66_13895 [Candidatus Helarchaeota archaeon]|nr:hypothetical protein [Candidatus Helarchaeota archaeon]
MPLYVMVTADFPDVDSSKRAKIYECLEKKHWTKVSDIGRDISTVWYASFKEGVSYEEAISITKDRFMNCACMIQSNLMCRENEKFIHPPDR